MFKERFSRVFYGGVCSRGKPKRRSELTCGRTPRVVSVLEGQVSGCYAGCVSLGDGT